MIQRRINEGKWWTIISVECWLTKDCNRCRYNIYCTKINAKKPVLKQVVNMLLIKHGEPPLFLIEKAKNIVYYDNI